MKLKVVLPLSALSFCIATAAATIFLPNHYVLSQKLLFIYLSLSKKNSVEVSSSITNDKVDVDIHQTTLNEMVQKEKQQNVNILQYKSPHFHLFFQRKALL